MMSVETKQSFQSWIPKRPAHWRWKIYGKTKWTWSTKGGLSILLNYWRVINIVNKSLYLTHRSSNLQNILQNVHPWYPLPPESLEIGWSCRSAGRAQTIVTTWLNGKDPRRSASRVLHFDSSSGWATNQLLVISGDLWNPMNCFLNVTLGWWNDEGQVASFQLSSIGMSSFFELTF